MPKIQVDGKYIDAKDRQMVLQACLDAGVAIPHYCYHPGLSIPASCRICLVEVEGIPKLVPACQTPIRDGMVVHSKSPKSVANQKQVMEYLLINHPLDCPVCDQAGECSLQDYSYQYGRSESRFEEDKAKKPKKDVGDNILLYSDRCIMCTRCVRFTREVSGTSELFVEGRGHKEEINIFPGKGVNSKLSGNVVDLCPVGALLDKDFLFKQRVWLLKSTPSISPADSGGENIYLDHNEGVVYRDQAAVQRGREPVVDQRRHAVFVQAAVRQRPAEDRPQIAVRVAGRYVVRHGAGGSGGGAEIGRRGRAGQSVRRAVPHDVVRGSVAAGQVRPLAGSASRAGARSGPHGRSGRGLQELHEREADVHDQGGKGPQCRRCSAGDGPARRADRDVRGVHQATRGPARAGPATAGWIVGGYLSNWLPKELPAQFKKGFRVLQDVLSTSLSSGVDVLLPAAAWAEKDGSWENFAGKIQAFAAAVPPPDGVRKEGDVYQSLLGVAGVFSADAVRDEMGQPFAAAKIPDEHAIEPAFEFAEL